jgi:hypothetical protein
MECLMVPYEQEHTEQLSNYKRMTWMLYVACMKEIRNGNRIFFGKT